MQGMIWGLLGTLLAASLAELLLPRGENGGSGGALRLIFALAVLLVVATPLLRFLQSEPAFSLEALAGESEAALEERYQQTLSDAVATGSEELYLAGIGAFLLEEYGIVAENAALRAQFDGEGMPCALFVKLSGAALLKDPHEIEKALAEKLGISVEVR